MAGPARRARRGIVAVQGLNIVRVISLFYLGQWNMQVFEWAHLYVWQALIMLDVLVVWLIWVRRVPQPDDLQPPPAAPPASLQVLLTNNQGRRFMFDDIPDAYLRRRQAMKTKAGDIPKAIRLPDARQSC